MDITQADHGIAAELTPAMACPPATERPAQFTAFTASLEPSVGRPSYTAVTAFPLAMAHRLVTEATTASPAMVLPRVKAARALPPTIVLRTASTATTTMEAVTGTPTDSTGTTRRIHVLHSSSVPTTKRVPSASTAPSLPICLNAARSAFRTFRTRMTAKGTSSAVQTIVIQPPTSAICDRTLQTPAKVL